MSKWIQKTVIAIVAVLTLGLISPGHEIWESLLQEKGDQKHDEVKRDAEIGSFTHDSAPDEEDDPLIFTAREMAYTKFGSKIGPVISDQFDTVIFPEIEQAIQYTYAETGDLHKRKLAIREKIGGSYSEKIFDVYDLKTGKNVLLFHVRTEKRPQDGYYFNFHYHTADDDFVTHHSIGDIYWSKNTPPKWYS